MGKVVLRLFNRWYFELLVVVAVALLVGGFLLFIQPSLRLVRVQGQSGLEASQRYVEQLEAYLDDVSQVKAELVAFNEVQRQRLAAIVPREQDFAGLFVQMQALAERHGLVLPSVNIAAVGTEAPLAAEAEAQPSLGLGVMTVNFSVHGQGYERFKQFLMDVQRNLRLFDVVSITFGGATTGPYTITLQTYYRP